MPVASSAPKAEGVDVVSSNGFKYRITVVSAPTYANGVNPEGKYTPTDAPPGQTYARLTVEVTNTTSDRNEPLADVSDIQSDGTGFIHPGGLVVAVPAGAVSAFNGSASSCIHGSGYWTWFVPDDACMLTTGIEAPQGLGDVQIPAGVSVKVVLVCGSGVVSGILHNWAGMPSQAPLGQLELFFGGGVPGQPPIQIPIPAG